MADLEIAGGKGDDGSEQSAAGRPEARSAAGRMQIVGWVREGAALDPLP